MARVIFFLIVIAAAGYAGYKYGQSKATKEMSMVMQLDEIARKQSEALKRKAYLFIYKNKRDAYFASDDKVDEYMKKNHKRIERIWTCQK